MIAELSSMDLHYLVKEFQLLIDGKIDKVFQKEDLFIFQLHLPGKGKRYFWVMLPSIVFISDKKEQIESDRFGLSVRKHISSSRIREVVQLGSERILKLVLETKNKMFNLYIELFKPGNIILADEEDKIIMATTYKGFGSRLIRPGKKYAYPKREYDFLELNESDIKKVFEKSDKSSIVITLATELGLGGKYSELVCEKAGVDKKKQSLDDKELKKIKSAIDAVTSSDIKLNKELDEHYTREVKEQKDEEQLSKYEKKKNQLESIKKQQENVIKGLEVSMKDNQKKGELIYENFQLVEEIIREIKKAKEKYSEKEIKEKLKGHKKIKDIDGNKVVLDL